MGSQRLSPFALLAGLSVFAVVATYADAAISRRQTSEDLGPEIHLEKSRDIILAASDQEIQKQLEEIKQRALKLQRDEQAKKQQQDAEDRKAKQKLLREAEAEIEKRKRLELQRQLDEAQAELEKRRQQERRQQEADRQAKQKLLLEAQHEIELRKRQEAQRQLDEARTALERRRAEEQQKQTLKAQQDRDRQQKLQLLEEAKAEIEKRKRAELQRQLDEAQAALAKRRAEQQYKDERNRQKELSERAEKEQLLKDAQAELDRRRQSEQPDRAETKRRLLEAQAALEFRKQAERERQEKLIRLREAQAELDRRQQQNNQTINQADANRRVDPLRRSADSSNQNTVWRKDPKNPGIEYIDTEDGYRIYQAGRNASAQEKALVTLRNLTSGGKIAVRDPSDVARHLPDAAQSTLDVGSLLPGVGGIADGTNTIISGVRYIYNASTGNWEAAKEHRNAAVASGLGLVIPGASGATNKAAKQAIGRFDNVKTALRRLVGKGGEIYENPSFLVERRVSELYSEIPAASRTRITMGVAVVEDINGQRKILVSTSEPSGYIRPGVKIQNDEIMVKGYKGTHAEIDILDFADKNNLKIISLGSTREPCSSCSEELYDKIDLFK